MKVVNKWNRRLLRAVRRSGANSSGRGDAQDIGPSDIDDHSIGSNEDDIRVTDGRGTVTRTLPRRTRESIMKGLPPAGQLAQQSRQHLDLLHALAYPNREKEAFQNAQKKRAKITEGEEGEEGEEGKSEEEDLLASNTAVDVAEAAS